VATATPPPSRLDGWEPLLAAARIVRRPLQRFLRIEAASGIVLLLAAGIALLWANSAAGASYEAFWETPWGLRLGDLRFERSLRWLVNDVAMVVFFFVAGLEIRRELSHGALAERRQALLPVVGALGGMAVPAAIYLALAGDVAPRGWAIPSATDIAFALGVLALLGRRVPLALRMLLLALAVLDDLGAIIVIALFYSSGVSVGGLLVAALGVGAILGLRAGAVQRKRAYFVPALVIWAGLYAAGLHPTLAGVLVGLLTPVRSRLGPSGFLRSCEASIARLGHAAALPGRRGAELARALAELDRVRRSALSPAEYLIEQLHPWVAFGIMPLFALANAGVVLAGLDLAGSAGTVAWSVGAGLVIGKPLGVVVFGGLVLLLGWARLPEGLDLRHLVLLGLVAGIGFTMALFVGSLAFVGTSLLDGAKVGILGGSLLTASATLILGWVLLPRAPLAGPELNPEEREAAHRPGS